MGTHQLGNWLTRLKIQLRDKNLLQTFLAPSSEGSGGELRRENVEL